MELVLSTIWAAAVAVLIARAIRQRELFPPVCVDLSPASSSMPALLVIVPARNEAANIAPCIDGLSRQTYPRSRLEVRIVDDDSSDDTETIARAAASGHERFSVIASPPLPPGWVGKPHACWTGATLALGEQAEWLCFIDADVVAEPELLLSAIRQAEAQSLDLLSLAPRQILQTWSERLVLPCGLYCLAFSRDLKKLQSERSPDTTVTGQFLLIRGRAYSATGGHEAVSNAICEDVALARRVKQLGGRVALLGGADLLSSRMYRNWSSLRTGLAKNMFETFGGTARMICTATAALLLAWAALAVPLIDASGCRNGAPIACDALGLAIPSSAIAFALHFFGARFFRIPLWYGFLFPLGYSLGAIIAAESVMCRIRGRVTWKERIYG